MAPLPPPPEMVTVPLLFQLLPPLLTVMVAMLSGMAESVNKVLAPTTL